MLWPKRDQTKMGWICKICHIRLFNKFKLCFCHSTYNNFHTLWSLVLCMFHTCFKVLKLIVELKIQKIFILFCGSFVLKIENFQYIFNYTWKFNKKILEKLSSKYKNYQLNNYCMYILEKRCFVWIRRCFTLLCFLMIAH